MILKCFQHTIPSHLFPLTKKNSNTQYTVPDLLQSDTWQGIFIHSIWKYRDLSTFKQLLRLYTDPRIKQYLPTYIRRYNDHFNSTWRKWVHDYLKIPYELASFSKTDAKWIDINNLECSCWTVAYTQKKIYNFLQQNNIYDPYDACMEMTSPHQQSKFNYHYEQLLLQYNNKQATENELINVRKHAKQFHLTINEL